MKAANLALAGILCCVVSAQAAEFARSSLAAGLPIGAPLADSALPRIEPPTPVVAKPNPSGKDAVRRAESPRPRVCFNPAETRANITAHRLSEPFRALRAGRAQGEALRAKLCKWKQDEFVYEISVLRRDGRIVRLYMNAQNGQAVGALDDTDRH